MYQKVANKLPRLRNGWRRNPNLKKSKDEIAFKKVYADYPANPSELHQFLKYNYDTTTISN